MAILRGAALTATASDVAGKLIGLGMSGYQAAEYRNKLREGNILLCVQTEKHNDAQRAEEIFKAAGARDIKCMSED